MVYDKECKKKERRKKKKKKKRKRKKKKEKGKKNLEKEIQKPLTPSNQQHIHTREVFSLQKPLIGLSGRTHDFFGGHFCDVTRNSGHFYFDVFFDRAEKASGDGEMGATLHTSNWWWDWSHI